MKISACQLRILDNIASSIEIASSGQIRVEVTYASAGTKELVKIKSIAAQGPMSICGFDQAFHLLDGMLEQAMIREYGYNPLM